MIEPDQPEAWAEHLRAKTMLLAKMSHEIRTPLATLVGFAEQLQETATGDTRELAEFIGESGRRLLDIMNSVLDFARLDIRQETLDRTTIDVVTHVRETTRMMQPLAEAKALTLAVTTDTEQAPAWLNGACLDRILINLLSNAVKYTDEGGIEVEVETSPTRISIHVADTGTGIDEKALPRLFEAFERGEAGAAPSYSGVGLGLAITQYLVHILRGRIEVASTQGAGSTFTIHLPRLAPPPEAR